jgi:virulence factor Mce-like protein
MIAAMVGGTVLAIATFGGAFTKYVPVDAQITSGSDAVVPGDAVRYLDVDVGTVAGSGGFRAGVTTLRLKIKPGAAKIIPANVTAAAFPASVFGTEYIQLRPSGDRSGPKLRIHQVVGPSPGPGSESFQTTFSNVYDLLQAVQPAKLQEALAAAATALKGQGTNIRSFITGSNDYLTALLPGLSANLPGFLSSVSASGTQLSGNLPDLLTTVNNLTTTAATIVSHQAELRQLITTAPGVADAVSAYLTSTQPVFAQVINDSEPLLKSLSNPNPNTLADVLAGVDQWAKAWSATEGPGPYVNFHVFLPIKDPVNFLLGSATGNPALVRRGLANVLDIQPPYTAANCPRYPNPAPGMSGSNCGGAPVQAAHVQTASIGPVGSAQEQRAMAQIVTGLVGHPAPQLTSLADLLLGPVLRANLGVAG